MQSFGQSDDVLQRIHTLDCANSDKMLASCDLLAAPPPEAAAQRKTLEVASVGEGIYAAALAEVLQDLACSGSYAAIYVVRGGGFQGRLNAAGAAASGLIDNITNKDSTDCPVATALTDADRAKLLQIKQQIEAAKKPGG